MTVWNDAQRSAHLAHANWMGNTAILMHLNERATGDPARDWLSSWAHRWFAGEHLRVLVLGSGEGWLERAVAAWPFVDHIDAVDFAADAVARAQEAARGIDKIHYAVLDLNCDPLSANAYDVVIAHSVLHHVQDLPRAFQQIAAALKDDGALLMNEYVGPSRFQFSDDVLSIMNTLLACLGHPRKRRPSVEEMIANDPTEAVRSDELLPIMEHSFEIVERRNLGGTILQHLLYETIAEYAFESPRQRSILDILCTIEGMLVDRGRVASDYVLLAARKRGSPRTAVRRPLPPRPEAARDLESDPLWDLPSPRGKRDAPASGESRNDWKPVLRLLRLAHLAQQPQRANLFHESRLAAMRERLRARGADPWQWLQQRAPDDRAIQCLLRTAATLARA